MTARRQHSLSLAIGLLCLLCLLGLPLSPQDKPPLTLEQIEELVRIDAPDTLIVGEIQKRGLAFVPTRDTIQRLRAHGAGPKTLEALKNFSSQAPETRPVGRADAAGVATRYIEALQKRDFRTVIDLTYRYQQEVAQLQAGNPQVLWPKVTEDYYSRRIKSFEGDPNPLATFQEGIAGLGGDPTGNIRAISRLLPLSCRWKLLETRADRERQLVGVYISLSYPSFETSPVIERRFLQSAILEVEVEPSSGLVVFLSRVTEGDTYWENLPLRIMSARWSANWLSGLDLSIATIGGRPPFRSSTRCSRWVLENLEAARVSDPAYPTRRIEVNAEIPEEYFPLTCTTTVQDGTGQTDSASFYVPKYMTGVVNAYCWVRPSSLWNDLGVNCMTPLLHLVPPQPASTSAPEPPRVAAEAPQDSGIAIRIGVESLEPPPVAADTPAESSRQEPATRPPPATRVEDQSAESAQPKEPLHFRVRHRHRWGLDQNWNVIETYCEGILSVWPEGHVQYICKTPDSRNRCEKGKFPAIKEVKLDGDHLRISLLQGGNWDFFGSPEEMRAAFEAIAPLKATPRKK